MLVPLIIIKSDRCIPVVPRLTSYPAPDAFLLFIRATQPILCLRAVLNQFHYNFLLRSRSDGRQMSASVLAVLFRFFPRHALFNALVAMSVPVHRGICRKRRRKQCTQHQDRKQQADQSFLHVFSSLIRLTPFVCSSITRAYVHLQQFFNYPLASFIPFTNPLPPEGRPQDVKSLFRLLCRSRLFCI